MVIYVYDREPVMYIIPSRCVTGEGAQLKCQYVRLVASECARCVFDRLYQFVHKHQSICMSVRTGEKSLRS